MDKVGRNSICPCGSGQKHKKCCGKTKKSKLEGLSVALRMKGGVKLIPDGNDYAAVVHTWDNLDCKGEPKEWVSSDTFSTEDEAMEYYKTHIRPSLSQMMSDIQESNTDMKLSHTKLE